MKKIGLILMAICGIAVIFGCEAKAERSKSLYVWAIGDCDKVSPDNGKVFNPFVKGDYKEKNFIWDSQNKTVSLYGAKNEYIAFQIIIEAKEDLSEVDILTSDFKGPSVISNEHIALFKEHYITVDKVSDWPQPSTGIGEYPDALIPFHISDWGAPFSIKKGRNQAVWVDIYIPKEAEAGEYTGVFSIIGDNFAPLSFTVKITVWDFTLPDESHLKAWSNYYDLEIGYGVSPDSKEHYEVEKNILKFCHKHRLEALHRHTYIRPKLEKGLGDTVIVDWTPYDERLGSFLDGSLFEDKQPPSMFLLPVNTWPDQRWPKDDFHMQQVCRELVKHFREKGWDLTRGYIYLWDEPEEKDLAELKKWAKLIKDTAPELKTTVAFSSTFNSYVVEELLPYIDLWLVDASHADLNLFKELKSKGKEVGFYQQGEPWCGNENLDTDGLAFRTWPWIAAKYDIDVIYLYTMTNWWRVYNKGTIWENPHNQTWSNSQGVLLYPGGYINTLEAIGSIRLKQLRRGLQDYEYIYLTKKVGKDPSSIVNSLIKRALTETNRSDGSYGEWSHNPEDWFIARKKMAYLILGKEDSEIIHTNIPAQSSLKKRIVNFLKKSLSEKPKSKILYESNFEDGSVDGWTGGRVQNEITYKGSKYALKCVSKGSSEYVPLEIWKEFPINENTKLSFAYYCKNVDKLKIICWSTKHKRNYSQTIDSPKQEEWILVTRSLKDFGEDIGGAINSIHIAVPNRGDAVLVIDDVRLHNE